ncbi:MAG: OmpA family protein [Bacteroidales bacterium]|jgi:outer membrane protein OmpA-like peptidoglycan-associated protein/tetratricopeptide (TPR) repeat protein|nr:OmpA family protein [Bacteroidales bacterium]
MLRLFITYLLLSLFSLCTTAQKKSAQKLYAEALTLVNQQDAILLFQKAIAKDSTYAEAYLDLARKYDRLEQYDQQVNTLYVASKKCERKSLWILAQLSKAAYLNGDYQMAYNAITELSDQNNTEMQHLKANIEFSIKAVSEPYTFDPINLGEQVNTPYHDYWPSLSIDEQEIVTTVFVDIKDGQILNTAQEDLFYSQKEGQQWSKTKPLSHIINSARNEGAQSLSANGKTMLFTACNRFDGIGACDLYIAYRKNGVWSPPVPLPEPLNTIAWEGHPSLSSDGKLLYFSSNRKGGYGGRDLYRAEINLSPTVTIGEIINLGAQINTEKHEISPFIHPDGKTLYFSSDGHIGLGRQDIFHAQKDSTGLFQSPSNFGYPINTHHDEIGLVVNAKGTRGYFSAERESSLKKDIYSFDIPTEAQAEEVTYLKASIKDKTERKRLEAHIEVTSITTGELVYSAKQVSDFTIPLPFGKDYAINVSCPDHLFYSENIALSQNTDTPFEKEILLAAIKSGERIILENVLFKVDSYELDTSFTAELNKAIALIKANPKLQFEISGHTDNVGSIEHNQKLSEQRAKVVYIYFIAQGVAPEKLSYKGYGQSRPISNNNNENRRTELLVR